MARPNLPHPEDRATLLLSAVASTLKVFAWMVFGFFLVGAIAEILGLLPFYQVIMPTLSDFLLRFAAVIFCFIGFVAVALSVR
ncbi:hypothetical protein IQ266_15305 [filamentous cyanobacterium LEGE 11480]|uniref:Uncharacterized protein n=1 Tax=Romeriopsis navalis LEGE 11480 TaxID=2777977 RepID=A0A928VM60_9CYAN|nr:hypothetical protein [Romeriopsis navalis]MBE9031101.1 hypothetical protein [Romeriopsis navalis LEGE 11480]